MGVTNLSRVIRRRERETRHSVGEALRRLREDAGLSQSAVARAAGIDRSFLGRIESGERPSSVATLIAVSTVLGADLPIRPYPSTGPLIHDRSQAPMVEAVLRILHSRWNASPEVPLVHPARGVADLVLSDRPCTVVIEGEVQSHLRRLEQQLRWHREKELSLPSSDVWRLAADPARPPTTSRLLVLRSTRELRDLANTYEATLRAAYPSTCRSIHAALTTGDAPWPGAGILWVSVGAGGTRVMDLPPPGVRLGRR
jgi:transcriptional regulator with XRE-family HTH domain